MMIDWHMIDITVRPVFRGLIHKAVWRSCSKQRSKFRKGWWRHHCAAEQTALCCCGSTAGIQMVWYANIWWHLSTWTRLKRSDSQTLVLQRVDCGWKTFIRIVTTGSNHHRLLRFLIVVVHALIKDSLFLSTDWMEDELNQEEKCDSLHPYQLTGGFTLLPLSVILAALWLQTLMGVLHVTCYQQPPSDLHEFIPEVWLPGVYKTWIMRCMVYDKLV